MIESAMRKKLVELLKPLHAVSVENGQCHPGTPDVWYAEGGIECKATEYWPARPNTPVVLDHPVTPQQKIFAIKRHKAGGKVFFMLTIAGEWLLFDGPTGAARLGTATRQELYDLSLMHWRRTPTTEELLQWLASD